MKKNIRNFLLLFVFFLQFPLSLFSQVEFTSSNLPIIVIETGPRIIFDKVRSVVDMGIINNLKGDRNYITDPFTDYAGQINIEFRGSMSQSFPKKSYGFETQDEQGNALDVSLLGLPAENDWVLYLIKR